ncbi:hypothetical protein [Shewanella sedimentimangrovi]|uniref:Uncharacterized protein n=1 Tax=Shewanella sedimentimangrovi TaxID=2814293 RepID=A0ABX7R3Z4_9GAMM|nr:hypothetical protein [Shewanella sedimentimangrovi]QSX37553.1 hypothetical protein JYB85_01525 [Shewanella sedimentimangrovi]
MNNYGYFCAGIVVLMLSHGLVHAEEGRNFAFQQCFANKTEKQYFGFSNLVLRENVNPFDRDLYVFSAQDIEKDWVIIDASEREVLIPGALKLASHTLKHKKYLAGEKIILIGNGRTYSSLENDAIWLIKNRSAEVKIFIGSPELWLRSAGSNVALELEFISPAEFYAESTRGNWIFVETEEELQSALSLRSGEDRFNKYLIINDELKLSSSEINEGNGYFIFKMRGGLDSLSAFYNEQGVILTAKKEREKHESCKGYR